MKISIRARDLEWNPKIQQDVERIIAFAVDRFKTQLVEASIHLADLNGEKGGLDKLCQITATLRGHNKQILILEKAGSILPAVYRAAGRLRHCLAGEIRRLNQPPARWSRVSVRTAGY